MNELVKPQTAVLEGASCSGKSTLLTAVASTKLVPIFKDWSHPQSTLDYFLNRDEDKFARARKVEPPAIALIDRGYLSTLTFYQVFQEQRGIPVYPVLEWFINNLGTSLFRPDLYVFVDIPPDETRKRAKTARKIDDNNMWLHYPERIAYWYEKLFQAFEGNTPIHHLDGTKPTSKLKNELLEILNS